jgi:hypothetical protein
VHAVDNERHGAEIKELLGVRLAPFADLIGPPIAMHSATLRLKRLPQTNRARLHELATNAQEIPGALDG